MSDKLELINKWAEIAEIAFDKYLNIVLQVWLIFIALECFILSREASRSGLNFELQKRSFERIPLISIFLNTNRYKAKRTMQWFVSH